MEQRRVPCCGLASNKDVMSITVIQLCTPILDYETCVISH